MSFRSNSSTGVYLWTGNPNCQAGHDWLLTWLKKHTQPFLQPPPTPLNSRIQGNLAETLSMCVGSFFRQPASKCFPINAHKPWQDISNPDIDLLWLGFAANQAEDFAVVQEVKSTGQANLAYAGALVDDYQKLFSTNVRTTLHTRLQGMQTMLEVQGQPALARRIGNLGANSPRNCGNAIRLIPTLVHDLGSVPPAPKMLAITATLSGLGWQRVEPWAIGLTDLLDRFARLSRGLN